MALAHDVFELGMEEFAWSESDPESDKESYVEEADPEDEQPVENPKKKSRVESAGKPAETGPDLAFLGNVARRVTYQTGCLNQIIL